MDGANDCVDNGKQKSTNKEKIQILQDKINNLSANISITNLRFVNHPTEKHLDNLLDDLKTMTNQQRSTYLQTYLNQYINNINMEHIPDKFTTISDISIKKKDKTAE